LTEDQSAKEPIVMKQDSRIQVRGGPEPVQDPHRSLHSETGARPGEHPGRSGNPLVKVSGLAWLAFEKPDLDRAERFYTDFGFTVADRTPETLLLRGRQASTACLVVRRGPRARFVGPAFQAAARDDLDRLARGTGGTVTAHWGGHGVLLRDPSGYPVRVIHSVPELPALPERAPLPLNFGVFGHSGDSGPGPVRANATQRPARRAAEIQRLGHVVLGTTRFGAALDWYLDTLGLIVSDFLYLDGQRDRGPAMAFIRCDLGSVPADHHTLAMALQPRTGYVHSAYQLTDLDEVAASGEYLREGGYRHAWGIGRHIQGSQIFDYWRDPDRLMFEHYADGDVFDSSMEPGWAPLSASGLAQWGPKATAEFTGARDPSVAVAAIKALREKGNEIDVAALRGLVKAMSS
jgi:catechol 2,3-dioxygenase-like lactoylglutathione lyase family enzyme